MIKRKEEMELRDVERMRGGDGTVHQEHFLSSSDMAKHSRLFSKMTLKEGVSIGLHQHSNETEYYYILSGIGEVDEGGKKSIVREGDLVITGNGESHSIRNASSEDLVFIALIILD